jgi:CelD/BcsL family acetyltransferase involved in cellulose biosynthesis
MSGTSVLDRHSSPAASGAHDGASGGVGWTVYDSLEAIETEWRQFEQDADGTAFQTFDWLATWFRVVGPHTHARPAIVVGRCDAGRTLFILPLAVTPGAVTRLTFLGSDLCDYNAPLLARDFWTHITPDRFQALWRDVRRQLQADYGYDLVELSKLPELVGTQANPLLTLAAGLNPSNAYVADLFGTWDQFYEAKRSAATRRRDRTKLKRLGEFGDVRFVTPRGHDEIARTMDVLFEQKVRSLARMGAPNIFARPGWREFYAAVAVNPRMAQSVHVSRLDAGPTFTAINLGLILGKDYYHVLASHDDGEASRFGPGVAHLRELLKFSIERGLKRFDFTIGDERYKREWADRTVPLYDHVAAATACGALAAALIAGHRRVKRLIKQNEALWSLFSRARAALGSKWHKASDDTGPANVRKSPPIAPS